MLFFCKNCMNKFKVSNKKAKGYYNWRCPICKKIAPQEIAQYGGYVFKCSLPTSKRKKN